MSALDTARVAALLTTARYGRSLRALAETDSTMDDARRAADEGAPEGHVVVADQQLRGRGSHGREWSSPPGADLYFSLVLRPALALAELPPLTLAVGLAVSDALRTAAPHADVRIKWPNDVFVNGKKCAGILVETRSVGLDPAPVIVGIGINVARQAFPPELASHSTSLALVGAPTLEREALLVQLLSALEQRIDAFISGVNSAGGAAQTVAAVEERLLYRGAPVAVDALTGTLLGVSPDGALRLRVDGVEKRLLSGRLRPL